MATFIGFQPTHSEAATGLSGQPHRTGLRNRFLLGERDVSQLLDQQAQPQPQCDIQYIPDTVKYRERASVRSLQGNLEKEAPSGWPKQLQAPLAWTGKDFGNEASYVHYLTENEKADVNKALVHFNELGLNGDEISRQTFPLDILSISLEKYKRELFDGKGFIILRGLDPEEYSAEDITVIFLGVSSYISEERGKQNRAGGMLIHVVDCAASCSRVGEPQTKHSQIAQPFHSDISTDIIAILTRNCAATGGRSLLASSWTVYNELAATRPDLIHVLAKDDWPFDCPTQEPPYHYRALLYYHESNIILSFARAPLTGHHATTRTAGIPSMTEAQAEALDAIHYIAQSHQLITTMEPGDIRFINNLALLHGREPFAEDQDRKRHLVRLWLRDESRQWPLPPALNLAMKKVFEDTDRPEIWDVEPPADWKVVRHFMSHGD